MIRLDYFIRHEKGDTTPVSNAEPFKHKGIDLFHHKYNDEFRVTECTTGCMLFSSPKSKEHAIDIAKTLIDRHPIGIREQIAHATRTFNPPPPKLAPNTFEA